MLLYFQARITLGFYATFLQDWFQVFPREQFLILRTEDFANATLDIMYKVFKFLDLRKLNLIHLQKLLRWF